MSEMILPEGWVRTEFSKIYTKIVGGGTPSKAIPEYFEGDIPWMSVKDMKGHTCKDTKDHITKKAIENSATNLIPKGVPIIATRMSLGKVIVASFDTAINQDLKAIFLPQYVLNPYFIYWYRSKTNLIVSLGTGTTVKGIRLDNLKKLSFTLCSVDEQTEIVKLLDSHLTTVTQIQARLDAIPKLVEKFRQSVLNDAVSGRLTEEWRKLNKTSDNWKKYNLGELVKIERGSSPRPIKDFLTTDKDGVNWIKIGDTKKSQKYIKSTKEKITSEGAKKSRYVEKGDLILSNSMSLGRAYIVDIEGYIHDGWFVFRLPKIVDTEFFYYALSSSSIQDQFSILAVGGVVKNIRSDLVRKTLVNLPSVEEQKEIVKIIEHLFAHADQIEKSVAAAKARVDNLTQSILHQAFTGNLTKDWRAQHPELISGDNSAEALLAKIQAEKKAKKVKKKK